MEEHTKFARILVHKASSCTFVGEARGDKCISYRTYTALTYFVQLV